MYTNYRLLKLTELEREAVRTNNDLALEILARLSDSSDRITMKEKVRTQFVGEKEKQWI